MFFENFIRFCAEHDHQTFSRTFYQKAKNEQPSWRKKQTNHHMIHLNHQTPHLLLAEIPRSQAAGTPRHLKAPKGLRQLRCGGKGGAWGAEWWLRGGWMELHGGESWIIGDMISWWLNGIYIYIMRYSPSKYHLISFNMGYNSWHNTLGFNEHIASG